MIFEIAEKFVGRRLDERYLIMGFYALVRDHWIAFEAAETFVGEDEIASKFGVRVIIVMPSPFVSGEARATALRDIEDAARVLNRPIIGYGRLDENPYIALRLDRTSEATESAEEATPPEGASTRSLRVRAAAAAIVGFLAVVGLAASIVLTHGERAVVPAVRPSPLPLIEPQGAPAHEAKPEARPARANAIAAHPSAPPKEPAPLRSARFYALGSERVARGDLDGAIGAWTAATRANPRNALAHRELGYALLARSRCGEAAVELETYRALVPASRDGVAISRDAERARACATGARSTAKGRSTRR